MFPEIPACWTLSEWVFASWLHTAGTQKSLIFPSACTFLESPHCTCCAQHTWTRWAFAESQFCWDEDWRTSSIPTTEGSAQAYTWRINHLWPERRQPALLVFFFFGGEEEFGRYFWVKVQMGGSGVQKRDSPCSLRPSTNRCDFMHMWTIWHWLMFNT